MKYKMLLNMALEKRVNLNIANIFKAIWLFGFLFFANIKSKLKISDLQISAILDITLPVFNYFHLLVSLFLYQ